MQNKQQVHDDHTGRTNRRTFMQYLAMLGIGGQALFRSGDLRAAITEAKETVGEAPPWPGMAYRTLGRTNFNASRLIFGCGATLMRRPADRLLETAFAAGVNVYDVGTSRYYNKAERHLAPFLKKHRDDIFLISKAMVRLDVAPEEEISVEQAKSAASGWLELLDESLSELEVDHVDAYYLMGSSNPNIIGSEEFYNAFQKAKKAGKVNHWGVSTHQNAQRVLETAVDTGWYDLAMLAITPAGWYDWIDRDVLPNSPNIVGLKPVLAKAKASGMGLIGMKAGRMLSGRMFGGDVNSFDGQYTEAFLKAQLSSYQRSYAFVLEHGIDAVNADMQNFVHLKENFIAAATSEQYFA